MQRRRFQTLVLLASNVLLPLLGLFSADWDPTAMLAFYLAERYQIVGLFGGPIVLGMLAVVLATLPWLPATLIMPRRN